LTSWSSAKFRGRWVKCLSQFNMRDLTKPLLTTLHWLPVCTRVMFRNVVLVWKCLDTQLASSVQDSDVQHYGVGVEVSWHSTGFQCAREWCSTLWCWRGSVLTLHWLPVRKRVMFNTVVLVWKCLDTPLASSVQDSDVQHYGVGVEVSWHSTGFHCARKWCSTLWCWCGSVLTLHWPPVCTRVMFNTVVLAWKCLDTPLASSVHEWCSTLWCCWCGSVLTLHWLPVYTRVMFNTVVLAWKCLDNPLASSVHESDVQDCGVGVEVSWHSTGFQCAREWCLTLCCWCESVLTLHWLPVCTRVMFNTLVFVWKCLDTSLASSVHESDVQDCRVGVEVSWHSTGFQCAGK